MVNVAGVLQFLFPAATPPLDYSVAAAQDGTQSVARWDAAKLGRQPTAQELANAEASAAYQAWDLAQYKKPKIADVQMRSLALLAVGFTYGGHQFDLSTATQLKLNSIQHKKAKLPGSTPMLTKAGVLYQLAKAAVDDFTDAAFDRGFLVTNGETQLIAQILAAPDKAAVDAIQDNRT